MSSYAMQIMPPKQSIHYFLVLFRPSYANGRQALEIVGLPAQQNGTSGTVMGWPYFCVGPKSPLPKLVANSDGFWRNLPMQEHRHIRTSVRIGAYQVKCLWRKIQTRLFSCLYQKFHQDPEPYLSRS